MTNRVYDVRCKTVESLKRRIRKVWRELEPELLMNLVRDMKFRMQEVPIFWFTKIVHPS